MATYSRRDDISRESVTSSVLVFEVHFEKIFDVDLSDVVDDVPGNNCQGSIGTFSTIHNNA